MQPATREWIHQTVDQLPEKDAEQLKDYLEFLIWKSKQKAVVHGQRQPESKTGKNPIAQRIIKAMEKPPYVAHEDIEALLQVISEAKQPTRFESPFEPDQREKQ